MNLQVFFVGGGHGRKLEHLEENLRNVCVTNI